MVKKLDGLYKNISEIPVFLIGQLAKNDQFTTALTGQELLEYAWSVIMNAHKYVGGRLVLIECNDHPKLIYFYEANGFTYIQKDELVQMIRYF